jgi:hypothetical protein
MASPGDEEPAANSALVEYWLYDNNGYEWHLKRAGAALWGESMRPGYVTGCDIVGNITNGVLSWGTVERNRYDGIGQFDFHLSGDTKAPLDYVWTNAIGSGAGTGRLYLTTARTWLHESFNDYAADGWGWGTGTYVVTPSALPNSRNSIVYRTTGTAEWNDVYYTTRSYSNFGYEASFKRGPADDGNLAMYLYMRTDGTQNNGIGVGICQEFWGGPAVYAVWKWVGGTPINIIYWTPSPNLITGADVNGDGVLDGPVWNTIKVITNGSQYDVYLNHLYETSFFDSEFSSGYVGLRVANENTTEVVEVDNVTVDPAASVVPLSEVVAPRPAAAVTGDSRGVR